MLVTSRSCLKSFCRQPLSSIISFHFSSFFAGDGGCWLFTPLAPYRPLFFFWKINDRPISVCPLNFDGRRASLWRAENAIFTAPVKWSPPCLKMNDIWLGGSASDVETSTKSLSIRKKKGSSPLAAVWQLIVCFHLNISFEYLVNRHITKALVTSTRYVTHAAIGDLDQFFFSRSNVLLDSHGYFAWPWTLKRRFCRVIVNHSSHPVA